MASAGPARSTMTVVVLIVTYTSLFLPVSAITITSGPLHTEAIVGESVELLCTVSDKGSVSVHWLRNDQQLSSDYELYPEVPSSRYSIITNGNGDKEFTLRITNVKLSDAGQYQCGYYSPDANFQRAMLSVYGRGDLQQDVQRPPFEGFPQCITFPAIAQVDETVNFTCISQGGIPPARLTWLQGGMSITGEQTSRVQVDRTLRSEHNGVEFTCRLTHPMLSNPKTCRVVPLSILPTVRIEPEELTADEGQGALFTCVANGIIGMERYTFFFRDEAVGGRDTQRFIVSDDFRLLTILDVRVTDHNAVIRCEVSVNNALSVSATATLRVRGVMDNVTTISPLNATATPASPQNPFGLSQPNLIIIIIVFGILIGQLICATVVYILHRCLTGRHDEAMNMEWKGVSKSRRDPHEIVPTLANWTAKRRYTDLTPGEVSSPRYQGLVTGSPAQPAESLEMGVYEGVAGRPLSGHGIIRENISPAPRTPSPRLAQHVATNRTKSPSPNSPKHPPPRVTSGSGFSSGSSSPKPSTDAPRYPPQRIPVGTPRVPPSAGLYKRPTSNALSSTAEDSLSYQESITARGKEKGFEEALYDETPSHHGSIIARGQGKGTDEVLYDETPSHQGSVIARGQGQGPEAFYDETPGPAIYSDPANEGDFVYEVPPDSDGYIHPDPKRIEDSDLDDYELPPVELRR